MNILLIRGPSNWKAIDLSHYTFSEPLGLQMLYTVFQEENCVEVFDMMADKTSLEEKLKEKKYDLCGISSACSDIFMIKNLAMKIKKISDIPIFVGGYQVKKTPQDFKSRFIDYIVIETTKENLLSMVNQIKNPKDMKLRGILEKTKGFSRTELIGEEETFVCNKNATAKYSKDYSYFIYKPVILLEFYREDNLLEKIKNSREKVIVFIDIDFFVDKNRVILFFENIQKLKIKKTFLVYGSQKNLKQCEEYYKFFRKNGLKSIILFFEEENHEDVFLVEKIKKENINIWAYFNLSPELTRDDFGKLRNYIKALRVSVTTLYPLNPFYDSKLVEKYKDNLIYKREIRANRYPGYVLIRPFAMSLKEYYIEIAKTSLYAYRFSLLNFFYTYGIKNSFLFFIKSMTLLWKYIKIISKLKS